MNCGNRIFYLAVTVAALVISIAINAVLPLEIYGQVAESSIPSAAEACIDRDSFFTAGGAELIAAEVVDETSYFLIFAYEDGDDSKQYPSALLVASPASLDACETELWNTPGDYLAFADFVPMAAAIAFREAEYSRVLETMGREAFIESFNSPEDLDLHPEFIDAFERLGVLSDIRARIGAS